MAADSSTDQPRFHKWMHEMTITVTGRSFTPTTSTWGPTAKVVSVEDKKGRVAYVPVEWLEKQRKPKVPKVFKVGKVVRGKFTGRVWIKVSETEWELVGIGSNPWTEDKIGRRIPDNQMRSDNWDEIN